MSKSRMNDIWFIVMHFDVYMEYVECAEINFDGAIFIFYGTH
jgi:hypothetical protein